MNKDINKGKGFLKDKMAGYQADPPPELWGSISDQLGNGGRRRRFIIILSAAASLALAITLGVTYITKDLPSDTDMVFVPIEDEVDQGSEEVQTPVSGGRDLEEKVKQTMAELDQPSVEEPEMESPGKLAKVEIPEEVDPSPEEVVADPDLDLQPEIELSDQNQDNTILALDAGAPVGDEMQIDLDNNKDKDPRWVLGAMLSPLYSFRDAEPEALAGTSDQESGTLSYAAGVRVGYRATRRLAFESGVLFNKMGISIGNPGIQIFSDNLAYAPTAPEAEWNRVLTVSNTVGNIVSNSGDIYVNNYKMNGAENFDSFNEVVSNPVYASQGIKQHLDYLEVPFNLRYSVLDRDFKIQLLGGMSTNFLVNNYVSMESGGERLEIGYLSNIRKVNYSGNAGLGFVYHFLDQLSVSLEPRFRYYLNSVNDATLPSTRPYTFGIYTGINYFF